MSGAVLLGIAAGAYLTWAWNHPLPTAADRTITVTPGQSLGAFSARLVREGLLPERFSFLLLARLRGQSHALKAGEYRFDPGISARQLLDQVAAGRVVKYSLVFIEGWTFKQWLEALARAPHLEQTLKGLTPAEIMARLGYRGEHPEGRFYPDTYYYTRGMSDAVLLRQAYEIMARRLEKEWRDRAPDLPLKSPYEALILASIIEKETGLAEERGLIAGVFINRLRKRMRLQTDPTVIYGLGESFDGNLRLRDLRRDTPYNTYTRHGLPPTPIAMPGGDALRAALHPAETRALYFVSRGDGSHVFSNTLREHNEAVSRYQLGGKRKPPPAPRSASGQRRSG